VESRGRVAGKIKEKTVGDNQRQAEGKQRQSRGRQRQNNKRQGNYVEDKQRPVKGRQRHFRLAVKRQKRQGDIGRGK
jgi:hypothetical protein